MREDLKGIYIFAEAALKENLSCLSCHYMLDQNNRELIVDFGVPFIYKFHKSIINL